ncbi:MAG TPA: SPOR domain-containing protein [Bacteroidales bacterium]|nr:SPOR domain-containing protein [Bacteroidales bacterium]
MLFFLFTPGKLSGQEEEVLLSFKHSGVGYVYANSIYNGKTGQSWLPVTELFSLMEINQNANPSGFTVSGTFQTNGQPYVINLASRTVALGKTKRLITPDDFRIGETDYYLSPAIFEEVFGLQFTVNIMHLTLTLETPHTLPVQERKAREKARKKMGPSGEAQVHFPLLYGRKRSFFSGLMVDYSLNGYYSPGQPLAIGYTLTGGAELLGGDLMGTVVGLHSSEAPAQVAFSGLRWRYAVLNTPWFTGATLGSMVTSGLQPVSYKGIALTNDPIEPRRLFDTHIIDGYTEPQSEVELYVNERITDFQHANELGYYRFSIPLQYGATRISTRIYTPSGKIITNERQMQVPFNFLPPGTVTYNVQAGKSDLGYSDSVGSQWIGQGNLAAGITPWLSASAGAQHLGNTFETDHLFWYTNLSARIARQYLASIDIAPGFFNRITGNVLYANNLSVNASYIRFGSNNLYNSRGANEEISTNVYIPFRLFGLQTGFRVGGDYIRLPGNSLTRYLAELNIRISKLNLRINYRDNLLMTEEDVLFGEGMIQTSVIYNLSRSPGVPVFIRGMFIRGQIEYNARRNQLATTEIQFSKTILKNGRINFTTGYNYLTDQVFGQAGLTIDLNTFRSATQVGYTNGMAYSQQNITGSLGWDMPNRRFNLSNRQQVGQSAASVRLFTDRNSNAKYDDGDELLPYKGVKLDQTSKLSLGTDSILRITQIQSYYRYNIRVNRSAINDPTLVPLKDEFSFVADPNQYKVIEIPFYRGGILDGQVQIERKGQISGQGGLRISIRGIDTEYQQTLRTFVDGSFYAMDIPPGRYWLEVDRAQLGFLNAEQNDSVYFEVKATANGDFIEGIIVKLIEFQVQRELEEIREQEAREAEIIDVQEKTDEMPEGSDDRGIEASAGLSDSASSQSPIILQAGAFKQKANAETLAKRIQEITGLEPYLVLEKELYKVRMKVSGTTSEQEAIMEKLVANRVKTLIIKL